MKPEPVPGHTEAPSQVYALVGASLAVRQEVLAMPGRLRRAGNRARRTRDGLVTTAYQLSYEAVDRAVGLPAEVVDGQDRLVELLRHRVVDLRDGVADSYQDLAATGERALTQWHAERFLNRRADRITRAVTPGVARATVSARDNGRRAAASPAATRARQISHRVRSSAVRTWGEYLTAIDEQGEQKWGPAGYTGVGKASVR